MFTGIIESVGNVVAVEPQGDMTRLRIRAGAVSKGVKLGDSIAVDGACLTVCEIAGEELSFDAVRETLERTALGQLAPGSRVNLERAMRADGRFDGHIVQGHVDGVGKLRELERQGDDVRFHVTCSPEFCSFLVDKGSVTIQGVSLTVVEVSSDGFHVALIPHTLQETTLGRLTPGALVNLEGDILGKYVQRYLARVVPGQPAEAPLDSQAEEQASGQAAKGWIEDS